MSNVKAVAIINGDNLVPGKTASVSSFKTFFSNKFYTSVILVIITSSSFCYFPTVICLPKLNPSLHVVTGGGNLITKA